jgi:hypothetical protein
MNWASHPYLYQLVHPWHWLTYGQNFSAFASLSSILVATATLVVVARQTKAANRQAIASEAQVKAAESAGKVSEEQLLATQRAAEAERTHSALILRQLLESMQPALVVVPEYVPNEGWRIFVENQGRGLAIDIRIKVSADDMDDARLSAIGVGQTTIGEGRKAKIFSPSDNLNGSKIVLKYRSQDGRYFESEARIRDVFVETQVIRQTNAEGMVIPFRELPIIE